MATAILFIFVSLPSPAVDEDWVRRHTICCTAYLQKMMLCAMFWSSQTICEWQIHWTFLLSPYMVFFLMCLMYVSIRFCLLTVTSPMLLIFRSTFSMKYDYEPNFRGCTHLNVLCTFGLSFYYFRLLTLRLWVQQSGYSIILALCANSRLCWMPFFIPLMQNM